jgi:predicted deacetylase
MIDFVLRFDDPSPTSNHALEREIFFILKELRVPATVAVVPFGRQGDTLVPVSVENVPHLVEAHRGGIIEVAQHGYSHAHMGTTSAGNTSEFWGMAKTSQEEHIKAGRTILEATFNTRVTGFVPPWNTYDHNTADILADQGYRYLSGSFATLPPRQPGFRLLPHTTHIGRLRQSYEEARRRRFGTCVIAVMHNFNFQENRVKQGEISLQRFKQDLEWLCDQPRVQFTTLGKIADRLSNAQSWSIHRRHQLKEKLHWRIQRHLPSNLLFTQPLWLYLAP